MTTATIAVASTAGVVLDHGGNSERTCDTTAGTIPLGERGLGDVIHYHNILQVGDFP